MNFQKFLFNEALEEDGLVIMAKGLGLHKILLNFLKFYCVKKNLVFILNVSSDEQQQFIEELIETSQPSLLLHQIPKRINTEYSVNERTSLYLEGGVYFVTSTILLMDFLYKRIPPHLIDGFLILHAEGITETSTESFIFRLYRQGNKEGFIKAFSEHPEAFTSDFALVEKIMKYLFVKKLFLWPRFRDLVDQCISEHPPDIVELNQNMTPLMIKIQDCIFEIVKACLLELKENNMIQLEEDLSLENTLFKNFEIKIKKQLESIWHQVGAKTKQLLSDLSILRKLLDYLIRYDCVSFYRYLETLKVRELGQHSIWLFLDAANDLFRYAKARVYSVKRKSTDSFLDKKPKKKSKKKKENGKEEEKEEEEKEDVNAHYSLVLEENPKWSLLLEVLSEIEQEDTLGNTGEPGSVLVMVKDERTCTLLQDCLELGGKKMLKELFVNYLKSKEEQTHRASLTLTAKPLIANPAAVPSVAFFRGRGGKKTSYNSRGKGKGKRGGKHSIRTDIQKNEQQDLMKLFGNNNNPKKNKQKKSKKLKEEEEEEKMEEHVEFKPMGVISLEEFDECFGILPAPHVLIHSFSGKKRVLEDIRPKYVIMYDLDIGFLRQLEIYKSENPGSPLRVYWLSYRNSYEEKKYLASIKSENSAFESLILTKKNMVIDINQDGKTTIDIQPPEEVIVNNSRKGGFPNKKALRPNNKVIIDSREFRSALPSILHQREMEILPCMLEVADYVITPEIGIERKSVMDLIQSFHSGRLYNQISQLCKHFKKPVLLIEFHEDKPFYLPDEWTDDITDFSIRSKLVLLTLHFPSLSIFWSRSPHTTADLFQDIKQHSEDPNIEELGIDEDIEMQEAPQDVLKTLPGITPNNMYEVMAKVKNLSQLSQMSLPEMIKLLGPINAPKLYHFFNTKL